jgi:hypothetical protein
MMAVKPEGPKTAPADASAERSSRRPELDLTKRKVGGLGQPGEVLTDPRAVDADLAAPAAGQVLWERTIPRTRLCPPGGGETGG